MADTTRADQISQTGVMMFDREYRRAESRGYSVREIADETQAGRAVRAGIVLLDDDLEAVSGGRMPVGEEIPQ